MDILGTNPTQQITVGKKDVWEPILPYLANIGSNVWNSSFAEAERQLREKQKGNSNVQNWHTEFAVKGGVAIAQDLAGLHVIPDNANAEYEFKVTLKEDSTVKAQACFTCSSGGATLNVES